MSKAVGYAVDFRAAEACEHELVGGKGANLGRLLAAGFNVPAGFTVSTHAYRAFLRLTGLDAVVEKYCARFDYSDVQALEELTAGLREEIASAVVPTEIAEEITGAYCALGSDVFVAVRSSGTAEDLAEASFAGQHDTYLDIHGVDGVVDAVKRCWASLWTARSTSYRARNEIGNRVAIAVVVQTMVSSEVAGVLFTGNPMTAATDEMVINSAWGLGEGVVSGLTQPDEYLVDMDTVTVISKRLGAKEQMVARDHTTGIGTTEFSVAPAERAKFTLTDSEVARLGQLGRKVTEYYDRIPQDIEWGLVDGEFYLLQSRPITGVPFAWSEDLDSKPQADYKQRDAVWTRAWADAFWTGAITPLFYSCRSRSLCSMYSRSMEVHGIPELAKIPWAKYYKGEVYFNTAAEPVIAPKGFPKVLRTGTLEYVTPDGREGAMAAPLELRAFLRWQAGALIDPAFNPFRAITEYEKNDAASRALVDGLTAERIRELSDRALMKYCDELVDWDIEACASVGAMYWHAVYFMNGLAYMVGKWAGLGLDTVADLVTGSAEPTATAVENLRLWRLSLGIRGDAALSDLFAQHTDGSFFQAAESLESGRAWLAEYREFLTEYSHRGHADRDIYWSRRCEDPSLDYNALKAFLTANDEHDPELIEEQTTRRREAAHATVVAALKGTFLGTAKAEAFKFAHRETMRLLVYRDAWRAHNDRAVFSLKRGLNELAQRLVDRGLLHDVEEAYFLGYAELTELLQGRVNMPLTRTKIANRRADFDAMDSRQVTRPFFLQHNQEVVFRDVELDDSAGLFKGFGTSPGTVTGRARIVKSLKEIGSLNQGDILVCNSTDPGWTPVFLIISGAVIETGGLLAHASCLAREYGFPAIQLDSAMSRIPDGATIRLDGATGEVTIIELPGDSADEPAELLPVAPGMTDILPGLSRDAFEAYLAECLRTTGPLELGSIRVAGQGMSDDTVLVDAMEADGRRHALAVRRYRPAGVLRALVDPHRHFRTLEALEKTEVPAPRPLWYDPDGAAVGGSTIGMEQLDGFVPVPWSPAGREFLRAAGEGPVGARFVSLLAEIHAVDWAGLGLASPGAAGSSAHASELLEVLYRIFQENHDEPEPILVDAFAWLRANAPPAADTVLVHGDYRTGNLLFGDGEITGVLDWEAARPGDPMRDLAWVLARSNRMDSDLACYILPEARIVELYEKFAGREVNRAAIRYWSVYHQVRDVVGWLNAASNIQRGTSTDLRMLRWSYTLPTMRRLVLETLKDNA